MGAMVTCRRCFRDIPDSEVDPALGFVECRQCNVIFEIAPTPARAREQVPMPSGVRVRRRGGGQGDGPYRGGAANPGALEVALPFTRWVGGAAVASAVITFVVGGVLAIYGRGEEDRWFALTVLPLTGLVLMYVGIACLVNERRIVVDADATDVRNGPVPWPGRRRVPAATIKQLYVTRVRYRRTRRGTERFVLRFVDNAGAHATLVVFDDVAQALWLEQAIERHLGIADVPVVLQAVT